VLSGDSDEIIAEARIFLKRKSFAAYCDAVLLPAVQLARIDLNQGAISASQQVNVRSAIVRVIDALGSETRKQSRWHRRVSVLDNSSLGYLLRQQRVDASGRWQGPLAVAPGSMVLCVGLGSTGDDLVTEIFVRILRDLSIDGRHATVEDIEAFQAEPPPEATPNSVSMVYIVSAAPARDRDHCDSMAAQMRRWFPEAGIIAVLLPQLLTVSQPVALSPDVNQVANSFEEAAQHAIARFPSAVPSSR
jgi:hypothetical protein